MFTVAAVRAPSTAPQVAVIGAGIAGLVASLRLASRGLPVTLFERAATAGGKLRQVGVGGAGIDAGPTVFTLRGLFEEIFDAAGTTLSNHLRLQPLDILARHAWSAAPGEPFDLHADPVRSAEAIGALAGAAEARGFERFCTDARAIYQSLERDFLRQPRPSMPGLIRGGGVRGLSKLWRLRPFTTLWSALGGYFRDPRLRQLFGRYATYCGSSPFLAPATLMLVAHVEQAGVWQIEGGMYALTDALLGLLRERGVTLRFATHVKALRLERGRVGRLELEDGQSLAFDAVISTCDATALGSGLLGREATIPGLRVEAAERSLSALTWNICAPTDGFPLSRHNVFFSADYAAEFADLCERRRLPRSPTVYLCAQDRETGSPPAAGAPERLLCLVNAPAIGDVHEFKAEDVEQCLNTTLGLLRRCGLQLSPRPDQRVTTTPTDFHRLFPGSGGALYGRASHGWQASFRRPGARTPIAGLYLAGGSTHPGPGLPMAALSASHAATCLLQDLDSMSRSRAVGMSGGTSMR
jgi:1-hydroxycarotenoid 3,4-desaturase